MHAFFAGGLKVATVGLVGLQLTGCCCCNPFSGTSDMDFTVDTSAGKAAALAEANEVESTAMLKGTAAATALKAIEGKAGGSAKYLEIDVYPDHVEAKIAVGTDKVEHYECDENGSITGPTPVNLVGGGDLSNNLFSLAGDGVSLSSVSTLAAKAVAEVGSGGHIDRISFKRNLPFDKEVRVKAFVEDDNDDTIGHRMTDLSGKLIEIDTDY